MALNAARNRWAPPAQQKPLMARSRCLVGGCSRPGCSVLVHWLQLGHRQGAVGPDDRKDQRYDPWAGGPSNRSSQRSRKLSTRACRAVTHACPRSLRWEAASALGTRIRRCSELLLSAPGGCPEMPGAIARSGVRPGRSVEPGPVRPPASSAGAGLRGQFGPVRSPSWVVW